MKKAIILVLTNFLILTIILLSKPVKAQTTEITGQFLYGLQLYVLPEKSTNPDYSTAIYSSTIDENDFLTSGLYQNWLQPRLPDGINGYIYLVDSTHTIGNVYLGGGYLEQGQTLSYPYEPSIELKHYNAQLIDIFVLNPVNKYYYEAYGGRLDYIVYYETNDGTKPRIKLIDATSNENDYNRVKLSINGYDTGYNAGYSVGYENGQNNGYNAGYQDGQNNGYNAGYNAGQYDFYNEYYQQIYDEGYSAGLGDRQLGVNKVVDFNQLIQNGNFNGTTYWEPTTCTLTTTGEYPTFLATAQYGRITQRNIPLKQNHIYCFLGNLKLTTPGTYIYLMITRDTNQTIKSSRNTNEWQKLDIIFNYTQSTGNAAFVMGDSRVNGWENVYITNFMILDLTQIYGTGNEPNTLETIYNDFPSNYYPTTYSDLINIDYENGYKSGYDDAYPLGYDDGKSYQATQQLTSDGWIKNIFTGIGSFLALEILPNVSIGLIVGIPFIITVAWFVLKMARGGSSE